MSVVDSIIKNLIASKKFCQKCHCTFETPSENDYFAAKTDTGFRCPSCRK